MKIAKIYTPIVVFVALILATIPWAWGPVIGMKYLRIALVSLIIACPCALVISTPIAYVCGLAHAARVGILIKGGQHLETLGHIQVLALDKTGTLTTGRFELQHLDVLDSDLTRDRVLSLLMTVESRASHPMSAAICASATAEGAVEIEDLDDFDTIKGEGVRGKVEGHMIEIGNRRLLERVTSSSSSLTSELLKRAEQWENLEGGTVGFMCSDGTLIAMFSVSDSARTEAKEAVAMLHKLGVSTTMLTGDNLGSALAVQRATGVRVIHASLLPEDKTAELKKLRSQDEFKKGNCCGNKDQDAWIGMVGDGVNDAPALALATVGIAMGATGTVAAMETADVTLMDTDLRKLAKAIRLGRMTVSKIRQNIIFSIVTKLVVFAISFAGYPFLWLAIATDVGAMIAVTINSSTLLGRKRKSQDVFTSNAGIVVDTCQRTVVKESKEAGGCTDGCCETTEVVASASDGCAKGCCPAPKKAAADHGHGHGHGHAHGHGHGASKAASSDGCAKGCCPAPKKAAADHGHGHGHGASKAASASSDGCAKGCCPAPKKAAADHGHGHGHGAQAQPAASSSDCSKGCCSKKEVASPVAQPAASSSDCAKGCCSKKDVASPVAVLAFRVSGEFDESLAADAVQLLDGVVSASFDGNDMISVMVSQDNLGVVVKRTLDESGLVVNIISLAIKIVAVTDNEVLEECDVRGVKNALSKVDDVVGVMLEGDSKRFHVWCVEGGEANDQKLIEQVDGLTGFDAIVEPEV